MVVQRFLKLIGLGRATVTLGGVGLAWALVILGSRLALGAGGARGPSPSSDVCSEVQQGPVRVRVTLTPSDASLSDVLTLTLRIESEDGVTVLPPSLEAVLGQFVIRDVQQPLPRWENQRRVWQQVCLLEPTRLGRSTLAPICISFRDARRGDGKQLVVQTEPLEFAITTVIEAEDLSLGQLHRLAGSVEIPEDGGSEATWILGSLAVSIGLGVLVWRRRIVHRRQACQAPSPQELARLELARILHEDLAEQDVKQFYGELSRVMRRYLERSYQVCALEQTTEEFLSAVAAEPRLAPDEAQQLRQFLESADRVKFAGWQPSPEDLEESLQRAKHLLGLCAPEVVR